MMQVTLKPHASLKEVFGRDALVFSVPEGISARELLERAVSRFQEEVAPRCGVQGARDLASHCVLLLNGRNYTNPDASGVEVKDGDLIEILAPLAGG